MTRLLVSILLFFNASSAIADDSWFFPDQLTHIIQSQKLDEVARLEVDALRERSFSKSLNYLPTINASASHGIQNQTGTDPSLSKSSAIGADININLYRFGADIAQRSQVKKALHAAELKKEIKILSAQSKAAGILIDALAAKMVLAVYEQRMVTDEQSIQAAKMRYKRGLLSEQELSKLQLEYASLQLSKKSAELQSNQALEIVTVLGGQLPQKAIWPLTKSSQALQAAKNWVQTIDNKKLKLSALEAEAEAAQSAAAVARKSMLPSLDLKGSIQKLYTYDESAARTIKDITASVTVPLFNRFSDSGEYRARAIESASATATLDSSRLTAHQDLKFAVQEFISTLAEAQERESQITIAEALYKDNLARFERGLISVNELSLDERRVRDTEIYAISTWQKLHTQLFKISELSGQSPLSLFSKSI